MKRRIAQDDVEPVTGLDRAFERILAIGLQSKRDVQGVAVANLFGGCDRDGVNIGARKFPTIFALANQRIDQASTGSDVERFVFWPTRDLFLVITTKQIGKAVDIVHAPRDRWAQGVFRDVPVFNAVMCFEERPIEHPNRHWVLKADGRLPLWVQRCEGLKRGSVSHQAREIISFAVLIARVQCGFGSHEDAFLEVGA